ncbi:hypothetical protein BJF84_15800 [Rhodococcus sp. CUA-806]|nr:hypothetical protein BJF84_15800 [Rhodococcus sp. CUA-806]
MRETGAAVVRRGPVKSLDLKSCVDSFMQRPTITGSRIHVRKSDDVTIVSDPDYVVDRRRLRATVEAVALPTNFGPL